MAIEKMKFVTACTDQAHMDEMLLTGLNSGMLHAEPAANIITEENNGQVINTDNPYRSYADSLQNIARTVGVTLKEKTASATYDGEQIEHFIQELHEAFGLDADLSHKEISPEDEKALDILSVCGFEKMHACQYLNFGLGRLPMEGFKKLSMYQNDAFVHHRLYANDQYVWLVYVTSDTYASNTAKIFRSLNFEPLDIPTIDIRERVVAYQEKMDDIYTWCMRQSRIVSLYPYVAILDRKHILAGFVRADDVQAYEEKFAGQPVDFRIKEPSEVPQCKCPTLLKNGWFARPFELFVEMYGLPAYDDFDPTLFFAITYCIMFGIMFGDMGQGLVLVVLGLLMEKKGRLYGIIGRVGIFSAISGFLFGSLFGYEDALNPLHQQLFHVREKLFDVMANSSTMTLLLAAVALGAVLILCSQILNVWNNARHHKWGEVLFSPNGLAGIVFYGYVLAALAGKMMNGSSALLNPVCIILLGVGPVLCFIMKGALARKLAGMPMKPEEGWGGYFTENFFEAFETLLSFVTNSMSYLRVGGFVLSHAGMMLVVMTLVNMTGKGGIGVLIFGNAFVMVLEGLIVGIQTLRLEYYEMFSRYYTGGGIPYKAFAAAKAE